MNCSVCLKTLSAPPVVSPSALARQVSNAAAPWTRDLLTALLTRTFQVASSFWKACAAVPGLLRVLLLVHESIDLNSSIDHMVSNFAIS